MYKDNLQVLIKCGDKTGYLVRNRFLFGNLPYMSVLKTDSLGGT